MATIATKAAGQGPASERAVEPRRAWEDPATRVSGPVPLPNNMSSNPYSSQDDSARPAAPAGQVPGPGGQMRQAQDDDDACSGMYGAFIFFSLIF